MHYKVRTSAFIASVIISAIFLVYSGDLYLKYYCVTYGVRISIQTSDMEQEASSMILKNVFLLENPSSTSFKVTYIKEEVYDDSSFEAMLGDTYKSSLPSSYIVLVNGFSNATMDLTVPLGQSPSKENLLIKVYMVFVDVPLLGSLYLTRYFPLNVSLVEGNP